MVVERSNRRNLRGKRTTRSDAPECAKYGGGNNANERDEEQVSNPTLRVQVAENHH